MLKIKIQALPFYLLLITSAFGSDYFEYKLDYNETILLSRPLTDLNIYISVDDTIALANSREGYKTVVGYEKKYKKLHKLGLFYGHTGGFFSNYYGQNNLINDEFTIDNIKFSQKMDWYLDDRSEDNEPDAIIDINNEKKMAYFPDDWADVIYSDWQTSPVNTVDPKMFLEVWRILKPGCKFFLRPAELFGTDGNDSMGWPAIKYDANYTQDIPKIWIDESGLFGTLTQAKDPVDGNAMQEISKIAKKNTDEIYASDNPPKIEKIKYYAIQESRQMGYKRAQLQKADEKFQKSLKIFKEQALEKAKNYFKTFTKKFKLKIGFSSVRLVEAEAAVKEGRVTNLTLLEITK